MSKWNQTRSSDCLVCPAVMLGTHQMWKMVVCLDDCARAPTASPIPLIIFQNAVGNASDQKLFDQMQIDTQTKKLLYMAERAKKKRNTTSYVEFRASLSQVFCVWARSIRMSLN